MLIMAYCSLTRGGGPQFESPEAGHAAFLRTLGELKGAWESKQRLLGLSDELLDHHLVINVCYLLYTNRDLSFYGAWNRYLDEIRHNRLDLESPEVLWAAQDYFGRQIYSWLESERIPFTTKMPIVISSTAAAKALNRFAALPDFHLAQNIPPNKLQNAVDSLQLSDVDTVIALVDCTYFGSAKDCVVIGTKAVYFNNSGKDGFLPYSDFLERTFTPRSEAAVDLGPGLSINLAGSAVSPAQLTSILDAIKKEVIARQGIRRNGGITELAGMQELKKILLEDVIEPLRNPEKFKRYGISIPNGILMYGPPGCGKTFVAQRLAEDLDYNFYEVSPSEVGSPYVHDTCLKIRKLFDDATASAPALIFVDEFEGLVPARGSLGGLQQHKAEEVNEWLVQIGSCSDRRILFVAATNEPWSIDPAVKRSGRLDKKIYVGPPDRKAIEQMLTFHLKERLTTPNIDVIGFATEISDLGYSASDLKLIVDEAARIAIRSDVPISHEHLAMAAADRVPPSITDASQAAYLDFAGQ
jgi:AAA+ superfamily predicted ATPase